MPDRLFHSLEDAWNGCMKAMGDVKELIPEFFYMSRFLENAEGLPLGSRQVPWSRVTLCYIVSFHTC